MQKKAAAIKKSAARKSKSFPKGKAASWSTDDVYNLLKAVNEITLKRMEDKNDRFSLDARNGIGDASSTGHRIENLHWRLTEGTVLERMYQEIHAIKVKVGA